MRRVAFTVFTLEMRFVIRKTSNGIFYYSIILLCDDDNDNDDNDGGGDDDNGAAPIIEPSSHLRDGRAEQIAHRAQCVKLHICKIENPLQCDLIMQVRVFTNKRKQNMKNSFVWSIISAAE